jgi:SAM-dependent methyltransferase
MRVLDVGAGSGRDVALLLAMGCDAYGVEPSAPMRHNAARSHPALAGRLLAAALPDLGQPFGGEFDGVVCSAVLMHLPHAAILDAAIALRSVLKENGKLLLSVPLARPDLDRQHRDRHGRLFTPLIPDYLQLLFERIGFHLLEKWYSDDEEGRPDYAWCTFLFRARHPGRSRALDLIEGVLNRDQKTATYKLALFRALAEIASTEFEQARWGGDGIVGIPVSRVAEKWILYYWPLCASPDFIPQIRSEAIAGGKPIAFRALLDKLIALYEGTGGLTRFVLDQRADTLPPAARPLLVQLQRKIEQTIVAGPVAFAGGSLAAGRLFSYHAPSKEIRFSTEVWRELSLVGHWIHDATLLRWAELTSAITKGVVKPSAVIDLLLTVPLPERDVDAARATYQQQPLLRCVWTGDPVRSGRFDVDHIIPFSLWRNNDVWNLVPAGPAANSSKSDKLPARALMHRQRDSLIHCWELLRAHHPARFDNEACKLAGYTYSPANWQPAIFQAVTDAIEFTAAQRGAARWHP